MKSNYIESQIYDQLNLDDSYNLHNDNEVVGPWHKYRGSSVHKKLQQLSNKVSPSKSHKNKSQNNFYKAPQRPGRRLSQEQHEQKHEFIEKPKYDQSRQVERIITEYFKEQEPKQRLNRIAKQNVKSSKNIGFFVQCYPNKQQKSNQINQSQQYQSTKQYFQKIANKIIRSMPNLKKPALRLKSPKQIESFQQKAYLEQLSVNNNNKNKKTLISYGSNEQLNESQTTKSGLINKSGKIALWKFQYNN